ncbi:HupE/UreJ family protein [Mesorhizobium sp. M0959]|uniref:HupE/UreJ family protein n=1 Tax=Mesorhizobium sp. M0959 TaxID=2957034 RepID=UPI00333C0543
MRRTPVIALAAMAMLSATSKIASAHPGVGDIGGFAHGFWHPIGGVDHVLAMVMIGLFAAHLGGRALYLGAGCLRLGHGHRRRRRVGWHPDCIPAA